LTGWPLHFTQSGIQKSAGERRFAGFFLVGISIAGIWPATQCKSVTRNGAKVHKNLATSRGRVAFIDHGVYLKQQNHYKLIENNN